MPDFREHRSCERLKAEKIHRDIELHLLAAEVPPQQARPGFEAARLFQRAGKFCGRPFPCSGGSRSNQIEPTQVLFSRKKENGPEICLEDAKFHCPRSL
jgi:hypothetical protein